MVPGKQKIRKKSIENGVGIKLYNHNIEDIPANTHGRNKTRNFVWNLRLSRASIKKPQHYHIHLAADLS